MSNGFVSVDDPGVFVRQLWARDIAIAGVGLPHWLRVHYLGVSRAMDGHANFDMGEISRTLGFRPSAVSQAIDRAVERDLLAPGSGARCLVMPDGVVGGLKGAAKCPVHGKRVRKRNRPSKKSPPTPTASDSRTPSACTSDTDRGSGGERVVGDTTCKVRNCGGTATARGLCDYCQRVELAVYERQPNRERADRFMDMYVAQGDPQRSGSILEGS